MYRGEALFRQNGVFVKYYYVQLSAVGCSWIMYAPKGFFIRVPTTSWRQTKSSHCHLRSRPQLLHVRQHLVHT